MPDVKTLLGGAHIFQLLANLPAQRLVESRASSVELTGCRFQGRFEKVVMVLT